jgi:hypothetical protein
LQREYSLRLPFHNLSQLCNLEPHDFPNLSCPRPWFSIFYPTHKDDAYAWDTTFELLLTAEGHKGEAVIPSWRVGAGLNVWIERYIYF